MIDTMLGGLLCWLKPFATTPFNLACGSRRSSGTFAPRSCGLLFLRHLTFQEGSFFAPRSCGSLRSGRHDLHPTNHVSELLSTMSPLNTPSWGRVAGFFCLPLSRGRVGGGQKCRPNRPLSLSKGGKG